MSQQHQQQQQPLTLFSLSQEILDSLLQTLVQNLILDVILQHNHEITDPIKQIVNLDKNGADMYFTCDNCGRKVSGNRFSAHLERCLERKR